MSDEFKKLDQLMERNVPQKSARIENKKVSLNSEKRWLGVAVAFGVSCIITVGVIQNHRARMESAVELTETLEWDVTTDESPEELEYTLAYLDE